MAKSPATQAMIERALRAWQKCGLPVGSVSIGPDGTVTVSSQVAQIGTMSEKEASELFTDIIFGLVDRSEADRLPDEMKQRLLAALAEQDQYLREEAERKLKRQRGRKT